MRYVLLFLALALAFGGFAESAQGVHVWVDLFEVHTFGSLVKILAGVALAYFTNPKKGDSNA